MELAFCDLHDLVQNYSYLRSEKLARTLFRQIVDGVEYMHSQGFAHMDLKPENILLGKDFQLKIADFDLCFKRGDQDCGAGTHSWRAPELKSRDKDLMPYTCDIYSLGLLLYMLMTGSVAYLEDKKIRGYDLWKLMLNDGNEFWRVQSEFFEEIGKLDDEFKKFFLSLVSKDPMLRPSFEEIRANKWYNGPVFSKKEISDILSGVKNDLE